MVVRFLLDRSGTERQVDVEIPDGLLSPKAIDIEATERLQQMRLERKVAPWRFLSIVSVDGEPWFGANGKEEKLSRDAHRRSKNPPPIDGG